MHKFFYFFLALITAVLSACQSTQDNSQMQQFQARMGNANGYYEELNDREEFNPIFKHLIVGKAPPRVQQIADTTKPTAEETELLMKWSSKKSVCRKPLNNAWGIAGPAYQGVQHESQSKYDAVLVKLIQRKITWGDANKENQEISLTAYNKANQLDENMRNAQLQAEAVDAQRRQAAAAYLIGAGALNRNYAPVYQPVLVTRPAVAPLPRPVTTNCSAMGNNVNCTSY